MPSPKARCAAAPGGCRRPARGPREGMNGGHHGDQHDQDKRRDRRQRWGAGYFGSSETIEHPCLASGMGLYPRPSRMLACDWPAGYGHAMSAPGMAKMNGARDSRTTSRYRFRLAADVPASNSHTLGKDGDRAHGSIVCGLLLRSGEASVVVPGLFAAALSAIGDGRRGGVATAGAGPATAARHRRRTQRRAARCGDGCAWRFAGVRSQAEPVELSGPAI